MQKSQFQLATVAASLITIILLILSLCGGASAFADVAASPRPSFVLDDLRQDPSFNAAAYPRDESNSELQVIQIAESMNGKLFIYVYLPCAVTRPLIATYVNMSQSESADDTRLYSLTYLSSDSVFGKYLVNGIKVSEDKKRYYFISSIYRKWESGLDDESGNDNAVDDKVFNVGKLYLAETVSGNIKYSCEVKETVLITGLYADFLEYPNGFKLSPDWCRSHYIAFVTEYDINYLYDMDVSYTATPCSCATGIGLSGEVKPNGESVFHDKETIKDSDKVVHKGDGLGATTYKWSRIEKVTDFVNDSQNNLKDTTKDILKNYQWIVRFTETKISVFNSSFSTVTYFTQISGETILRLHFKSKGETYNLGAVSDRVTEDDERGNDPTPNYNWLDILCEWLESVTGVPALVWKIIICALPFIIFLPILSAVFPIVGQVFAFAIKWLGIILFKLITVPFKLLWAVICAPFRAAKRRREKRKKALERERRREVRRQNRRKAPEQTEKQAELSTQVESVTSSTTSAPKNKAKKPKPGTGIKEKNKTAPKSGKKG